jgi:5'-nucleotidase
MSLKTGFDWGEDTVDDIKAYWIDGTPADAAEFAAIYFKEPFDLIISGINWGANLGTTIFSSGTIGAVLRGLSAQVASQALAISWDLPADMYLMNHDEQQLLAEYIQYPGKIISPLLDLLFENQLWGANLININLPQKMSSKVKITTLAPNAREIYDYSTDPFSTNDLGIRHFSYKGGRLFNPQVDPKTDVMAITDGCISVSPCKATLDDLRIFQSIKQKTTLLPIA